MTNTAITQALAIFKSYRRPSRKKGNIKRPDVKSSNVVLLNDTHLFWFDWGSLKIATHKGHLTIPLEVYEYSEKFKGWNVKWSRLVRRNGDYWLHVTFRRDVERKEPQGVLRVDVNEKSIDLAIVKRDKVKFVKIDVSEAKFIRDRYFKKRRSIQGRVNGEARSSLLKKYSGREKRRVHAILHKASKVIAKIIDEEGVLPIMKRLKGIRKRVNRRLHSMPFRISQSFIEYKALESVTERSTLKLKTPLAHVRYVAKLITRKDMSLSAGSAASGRTGIRWPLGICPRKPCAHRMIGRRMALKFLQKVSQKAPNFS